MNIESIQKQIFEYLLDDFPNQGFDLDYDTDLLNEWFIDSFAVITIILFLEEKFGLSIKRADINSDNFVSINAISSYIFNQLK